MSYSRIKFFWGALDVIHSDESPYTPAQTKPLGANALPPGIGVRRAQFVFTRQTLAPAQDAMTTHLDFLNLTAGSPDDTWNDADFTDLETLLITMWNNLKGFMHTSVTLDQIRWYREGPEVLPPNPAIRITDTNIVGTNSSSMPPQVAATVTLKTVPRRQWGRLYLPFYGISVLSTTGRFTTTSVQTVANEFDAFFLAAQGLEKPPVIFSKVRGKAYTVETLQVDDVPDVMRSRRFNEATLKVIKP